MVKNAFVFGVDYGTDSVRAILVNTSNGNTVATAVFPYPRWSKGLYCNPAAQIFRQHPLDYVEGLEFVIKSCLQQVDDSIAQAVVGLSIDTTGSTPVAVDAAGVPLALHSDFEHNPNAMFVLWKDHSSIQEADELNKHAADWEGEDYLQFVGGIYSSEWYWAKLLHILRVDLEVRNNIAGWVEHADWMPFLLTGGALVNEVKRGVCTAGHKGLWAAQFGGFPPNDFFNAWDNLLDGFAEKLPAQTFHAAQPAGFLSKEWAERLGLSEKVVVGIGLMDAHAGAVGGEIEPYYLSKVIGTSTCDMVVVPTEDMHQKLVKGICGQVNGSIIPNMVGLEAGQSAFGDVYAWFKQLLLWPMEQLLSTHQQQDGKLLEFYQQLQDTILINLTQEATKIELTETLELSIDWLNGRRTPDANPLAKGAITGLHLGTDAPRIFKSLVEATCFGAKAILERIESEGIAIKGIIALGGIAQKSPYIMQVLADVLNRPISVHNSEQTCALGTAMFAATVSGVYPSVQAAMAAMGQGFGLTYHPNAIVVPVYEKRYQQYVELGKSS